MAEDYLKTEGHLIVPQVKLKGNPLEEESAGTRERDLVDILSIDRNSANNNMYFSMIYTSVRTASVAAAIGKAILHQLANGKRNKYHYIIFFPLKEQIHNKKYEFLPVFNRHRLRTIEGHLSLQHNISIKYIDIEKEKGIYDKEYLPERESKLPKSLEKK